MKKIALQDLRRQILQGCFLYGNMAATGQKGLRK